MRKSIFCLLLACLLFPLTSCYDAHEVEELLHVLVIGIDQGISDKWRLSFQMLTVSGAGDEQGSTGAAEDANSQDPQDLVTIDAPSFFAGVNMINTFRPRQLVFTHSLVIMVSEEIAESGLVEEYIEPISRFSQIRRSAHVLVVKGSVEELLKENQAIFGQHISDELRLILDESKSHGFFPLVTFEQFNTALRSHYSQPIATLAAVNKGEQFAEEGQPWLKEFRTGGNYIAGQLPRIGKNHFEFFGTAVFRDGYLVGELTGDETRYMLMARGEFQRGFFTIPDPDEPDLIIPLDVRAGGKPQVNVAIGERGPEITIKIKLNLDLLAVQSRIKYEQSENKLKLEEYFGQIVRKGVEDVIKTCQELESDIFYFGEHAARQFWTIPEFEAYNWNGRFKDAEVKVEISSIIRRTGRQIRL